ncbi:hypothetical protein NPIL_64511 [Nephila pilipes]|uniref:Uncharacterized protein n=1 Tax=Nephila pilipes TaxID=299642 RepID=A0A8X6NAI4_NEPPI|nr:hypothetical protein NPIL_64511 [Nephila pilipes]
MTCCQKCGLISITQNDNGSLAKRYLWRRGCRAAGRLTTVGNVEIVGVVGVVLLGGCPGEPGRQTTLRRPDEQLQPPHPPRQQQQRYPHR